MAHHQPRHAAAHRRARRTPNAGAHAARSGPSGTRARVKALAAGLALAAGVTSAALALNLSDPTTTTVAGTRPHAPAAADRPTAEPTAAPRPSPYLHVIRLDARPTAVVQPPHDPVAAGPGTEVDVSGVAPFSAQTRHELAVAERARAAAADRQARERAARDETSSRSDSRQPPPVGGSPRQIAQQLLAARGWSAQFGCLQAMWNRESGWNPYAQNPGSGAYGIPQALPGSKMAAFGADWRTNPQTQIEWGLWYIGSRYGTPCGAWSFWQAHNYY